MFNRLYLLLIIVLLNGCSRSNDQTFSYWTYTNHALDFDRIEQILIATRRISPERCGFIAQAADSLIAHIEQLEQVLLDSANQPDPRKWGRNNAPDMVRLLSIEPASSILVGDPSAPNEGPLSGESLRHHIAHFRELVGGLARGASQGLYSDDLVDQSGTLNRWVNVRFYHLPLIAVLDELNTLKIHVRATQMEGIANCERSLALMQARGDSIPPWSLKW